MALCGNCKNDDNIKFTNELEDLLQYVIRKEDFLKYNMEKKLISNKGGNYLGVLYEVNIDGETLKGKRKLNLFLKVAVPGDNMNLISVHEIYSKETFAYDKLSKIFYKLQENAKVPKEERYKFVKCYGVTKDTTPETIVLENMAMKGYSTCDRWKCVDLEFAEFSIENLAKFHSLSYVLKVRRKKDFEDIIMSIDSPFKMNEEFEKFTCDMVENTISVFEDDKIKDKIRNFCKNMQRKYEDFLKPTEWSLLAHGDYRANNILVKYEEGRLTDVVPVDYQLIHYTSPLNDFMYFIFGATDSEFRRKHLKHLIKVYRDSMTKFLTFFDVDVEDVYPKNEFDNDFKYRLGYGLIMAILLLPIILAPDENVPDFGETKIEEIKFELSDVFKKRITDVVKDFIEWGYM